MADVVRIIRQEAGARGLDPFIALATAIRESNLNPNAAGDPCVPGGNPPCQAGMVPGQPCSYGLFQLNICGGEGTGLTPDQAKDPIQNARIAIQHLAEVAANNRGLSPGDVAYLAQRPADRTSYVHDVNAYYQLMKFEGVDPKQLAAGNAPGLTGTTQPKAEGTPPAKQTATCRLDVTIPLPPPVSDIHFCADGMVGALTMLGGAVLGLAGIVLLLHAAGGDRLAKVIASAVPGVGAVSRPASRGGKGKVAASPPAPGASEERVTRNEEPFPPEPPEGARARARSNRREFERRYPRPGSRGFASRPPGD